MVPQVLQLNEMQPCWEERLPHCPRYPPIIHTRTYVHTPTHKPQLFSCYPHAVPAPTLLMFIHQPLKGQMQRPVKTKSGLLLNDAMPSPLRLRQPDLRGFPNSAFKEGPSDGRWPHVHSWEQSEKVSWGKPVGGMKEGGMDREWGLTFIADDPLPAIQAQSWSLIDRSKEGEGGNRRSLEWELHKTYSHIGGCGDAH